MRGRWSAFFRLSLLCPTGIGGGGLRSGLIGEPTDTNGAVGLVGQAHANQEFATLLAGCQVHIAVARLGKPTGAHHLLAAGGTLVFAAGHRAQGRPAGSNRIEEGFVLTADGPETITPFIRELVAKGV